MYVFINDSTFKIWPDYKYMITVRYCKRQFDKATLPEHDVTKQHASGSVLHLVRLTIYNK